MTALPRLTMSDTRKKNGDVLLGEDWVSPDAAVDPVLREGRSRRGMVSLNNSPLARKIIIFNLMALIVLVAGVLFMNPFRDSLVLQREQGLLTEAELIADVFEASLAAGGAPNAGLAQGLASQLAQINIGPGVEVFLFDAYGEVVGSGVGVARPVRVADQRSTIITDFLNGIWDAVSNLLTSARQDGGKVDGQERARSLFAEARAGQTAVNTGQGAEGGTQFAVATPVWRAGEVLAVVALTSAEGEIDRLVRYEREQILQMFVIALLVSIGLSLVLASTIANPLSDLAAAAELGRDRDARKMAPGRVRIPDLAARPDEIGRLSVAMRGMVAALYDRIDANEQFAADVAHEIKNPLASLRSAVGTLRVAKRDDHRIKLLDVIEHDVRRLDRLVSDISNASRLDSELVKEEE